MKALVYTGPVSLEYRDEPDPVSNADVMVKVAACGICGSDMHAYLGHDERRNAPLILGHEAAGEVLDGPMAGKRVAVNPLVTCGTCDACLGGRQNLCSSRQIISMMPRPGAFAELLTVPQTNIIELPEGMSYETAALTEPLAVSYHAVNLAERALSMPLTAARIVILGGGAIGMGAAHIVRSRGGHDVRIAEMSELRRGVIQAAGTFQSYMPGTADEPAASTVDLVIDAYGGERSREAACNLARPGGAIIHIGLASGTGGLDIRKLTLQEIAFIGTYTYTMVEFRETMAGLAAGTFGDIDWVEQRPLSEGAEAFRELRDGSVATAKIILRS
ncbi:MAG: threonine dehydrogenase-like Zn-dependent dehydrogenase [Hyphomicrobiaceae bacterium]|jgi:threonine dehydrogenase-like Zn-dependent dehydrogenase